MVVLPLAYLGNVHYFSKLCFADCMVDVHEHFVKQSLRNRCAILSADGVTNLTVNVVKMDNDDKRSVRETRIDYSKRWQHRHWLSLVSAYKGAPYFDFYADRFEPFYRRRFDFLFDFNRELTLLLLELLGSEATLRFSEKYIDPSPDIEDFRSRLSEKPRLYRPDPHFSPKPYYQVFSDRMDFVPGLSVVDLLFCEGPHALEQIKNCITP